MQFDVSGILSNILIKHIMRSIDSLGIIDRPAISFPLPASICSGILQNAGLIPSLNEGKICIWDRYKNT